MVDQINGVATILCDVGKIKDISPDEDFYKAGFSSVSALQLLLELETAYDVKIPDDDFIAARTPRALKELIHRLKQEQLS